VCCLACRKPVIVSKADIEREKEALRAINTRPIKKVAEAKARKQRRLAVGGPYNCVLRKSWFGDGGWFFLSQ
jgi:Spb1 C-terminal domain